MLVNLGLIFVLLLIYQIKHLVCDYFLQGKYMLGKFNEQGWVKPLSAHCGVHALATFVIATIFTFNPFIGFWLALFDFITHFLIDRTKVISSRDIGTQNPKFWHYLGIDQMLHHIIHYFIIIALVLL